MRFTAEYELTPTASRSAIGYFDESSVDNLVTKLETQGWFHANRDRSDKTVAITAGQFLRPDATLPLSHPEMPGTKVKAYFLREADSADSNIITLENRTEGNPPQSLVAVKIVLNNPGYNWFERLASIVNTIRNVYEKPDSP